MFCPTCGKDNSMELRYCASCGTNLEAVTQALTGTEEDFFTKIDTSMDQFIARYSDHVFKNNFSGSSKSSVVRSWRLLGQGVITSLLDMLLFALMWNVFPLRFIILLITSPFRMLSERHREPGSGDSLNEGYSPPELEEPQSRQFLSASVPSVTEHTTVNLGRKTTQKKDASRTTDKLD